MTSAGEHLREPGQDSTYVVWGQVGVVSLYAVIQDGDYHVLSRVAPLPRRLDVHF